MQVSSDKQIQFSSEGSGSFLSSIMKNKLINTWKVTGVKYLNIIDFKNLTAKILDPFSIGILIERGYDCISDAYPRDKNSSKCLNPCILENKFNFMDIYYPFEVNRASEIQNNPKIFKYESLHLNMYTSLDFIMDNFS